MQTITDTKMEAAANQAEQQSLQTSIAQLDALREAIVAEAESELRGTLQRADGTWVIDYVRIRLRAVRV